MRAAITYESRRYYVSGKDEKDLAVKKAKIYTHYTETSLNNAAGLLQQYRSKNG